MVHDNSLARWTGALALVSMSLAWLIPNHYPPWTSYYNEACMFVSLALMLFSLAARGAVRGLPAVAWGVAALAAIPWLQWLGGQLAFSGDAWIASLYLMGFAMAIATGHGGAAVDTRRMAGLIAAALLVAGIVSSLFAILQALEVDAGLWVGSVVDGRPAANLAQPNNLATLLGLAAVALLLMREQGRIGAGAGAVLILVLLMGISVTNARVALAFGPAVLILTLILKRRHVVFRTRPATLAGVTALHWLMAWGYPKIRVGLFLDAAPTLAERGLESARFLVWPVLVDALSRSPWSGYGWLQVGAAELEAVNRHPPTGELWLHAHNLVLDLLIWCGYPLGLLISALLLGWFVSRMWRVMSVEAAIGLLVVAIIGVHSMLELPYHYAYFLIPMGLWVGIVECDVKSRSWLGVRSATVLVATTVVLAGWICYDYAGIEEDFRTLRFELLKIGPPHAAESTPEARSLSSLVAFLRYSRTPPRRGMSDAELANMRAVVQRYPYAPALYRYAQALALNGQVSQAAQVFEKIRCIHEAGVYRALLENLREKAGTDPAFAALDAAVPGH